MKNSKAYPFALVANGVQRLPITGDNFKISAAGGALEVTTDLGTIGPIYAGQGMRKAPFSYLILHDLSGNANSGTLFVSDGDFIDDRITGEVSVIDGEKTRTLAGGMFCGAPYQAGAAAKYSVAQLWNPALSGKNIVVRALSLSSSVATSAGIYFSNAALTTDVTATRASNKKAGAPMGQGLVKTDQLVAYPVFQNLYGEYISANLVQPWAINGALVVTPGYGLNVVNDTANSSLLVNYEWFEEAA